MCSKFSAPSDCVRSPSEMVRVVFAAGHSTSVRVSNDSFASAASSGSAPHTWIGAPAGIPSLIAVEIPPSSPPPETGDSTTTPHLLSLPRAKGFSP